MPPIGSCLFPATDLNPQKKVNKNSFWTIIEKNEPLDFYAHEGGGVLGSIQYILANHDLVEQQGLRNAQDHTPMMDVLPEFWRIMLQKNFV